MTAILTSRFEDALIYATRLHDGQLRKGNQTPYLAHLLGVAALVLEEGGSEDQAIAALLHDAVEDQGGQPTLDEIRRRFGDTVAGIVDHCTDSYETPKRPWRERKEEYLARLREIPDDARLVSLADKVYNARTIVAALRSVGAATWERFKGGRDGVLWYYASLVDAYCLTGDDALTGELERVVAEMKLLAGEMA